MDIDVSRTRFINFPVSSGNFIGPDTSYLFHQPRGFTVFYERCFFHKNRKDIFFISAAGQYSYDHSFRVIYKTSRVNENGSKLTAEYFNSNTFSMSARSYYFHHHWLLSCGAHINVFSNNTIRKRFKDGTENISEASLRYLIQFFASVSAPVYKKYGLYFRHSYTFRNKNNIAVSFGLDWRI